MHWPMTTDREVKFAPADLTTVTPRGQFSGYASLFNQVDLGRDMIVPGAFQKSLAKRQVDQIKLLFQHNPNEPIGVWDEIREDKTGLFVRGHILPELNKGKEILTLMKAGVLDGLSIGFKTVKGRMDPKTGIRRITEVDLWEVSIVTFPMLPGARIHQVKGLRPTLREFERWLMRDVGLSRQEARVVLNSGFKSLPSTQDADGQTHVQLGAKMRQAIHMFNC